MTVTTADEREVLTDLRIVDADSHVIEPADLWTARLQSKYKEMAPRIEVRPGSVRGTRRWRVGDAWLYPEGFYGFAGWAEYPPSMPRSFDDIDPAGYDPHKRLERMDEYGISAQVLYPNIIGFNTQAFIDLGSELSIACTRAYNDFVLDFAAADPERLIGVAMLPFWNLEEAVKEVERCAKAGHRGMLVANKYERIGLPSFVDPYWDPVYEVAQYYEMSLNFHIGFADSLEHGEKERPEKFDPRWTARRNAVAMIHSNTDGLADILTSGICDRFPRLNFVSVESGMGYVPYLLESLDWHWKGHGAHRAHPVLPSEYFRRQCYGTFWFETCTLDLLTQYPENFMFSTDFPHPTSVVPGPVSPAAVPREHVVQHFGGLPAEVASLALHGNADRLYRL